MDMPVVRPRFSVLSQQAKNPTVIESLRNALVQRKYTRKAGMTL